MRSLLKLVKLVGMTRGDVILVVGEKTKNITSRPSAMMYLLLWNNELLYFVP